jgi:hypothetical protein
LAARTCDERGAGLAAGVWAGRVAGWILAVGLLAMSLWASRWFVHSAVTINAYRSTFSSGQFGSYHTHFRSIAGYVLSENIDDAVGSSLLLFPLLGLAFGSLGGALVLSARFPGEARKAASMVPPPGPR